MKQLATKILRVLGVTAVLFLVVSSAVAQSSFNKDRRLRIKRGVGTVTVRGYIGGEAQDRYTVRIAAGRDMLVTIHSAENRADFSVCDEDKDAVCGSGEAMAAAGGDKQWAKRIPRTGDYYILVTAYPEAAHYTLRVTLKR